MLGISRNRLRALGKKDPQHLGPGHATWLGEVMIYLYDEADMAALRAYPGLKPPTDGGSNANRRGRPPIWSDDEQESRHRRYSLAGYYRAQANRHEHEGHPEKAAKHRARARSLTSALHLELEQRRAEVASRQY